MTIKTVATLGDHRMTCGLLSNNFGLILDDNDSQKISSSSLVFLHFWNKEQALELILDVQYLQNTFRNDDGDGE